jgi:hypothetical protein
VLITVVDTDAEIYDSTRACRDRALSGQLHSGTPPAGPARGAVGTPSAKES